MEEVFIVQTYLYDIRLLNKITCIISDHGDLSDHGALSDYGALI